MLGSSLDSACSELSESKRRKVVSALLRSGLVDQSTRAFQEGAFRAVLDATPVDKREGVERFVDGLRIRHYPANLEERRNLLKWVADQAIDPGEVLTENQVNDRLRPFSEDVAVLRRYLIDYQLFERRSDGTEYALTGSGPVASIE